VALNGSAQGSVSPFEILHSVVHLALGPYFDAYTKGQEIQANGRINHFADGEARTGIPVTKKKLAELELSLLHLQQNIEIPELSLVLHNVVQLAVDEVWQSGLRIIISWANIDLISRHTSGTPDLP
jgi:dynein heavy chain 1